MSYRESENEILGSIEQARKERFVEQLTPNNSFVEAPTKIELAQDSLLREAATNRFADENIRSSNLCRVQKLEFEASASAAGEIH